MRSLHAVRVNFHLGFISSEIALDRQWILIAVVHVADAIISSTWTRQHEIVQTSTGLNIVNGREIMQERSRNDSAWKVDPSNQAGFLQRDCPYSQYLSALKNSLYIASKINMIKVPCHFRMY